MTMGTLRMHQHRLAQPPPDLPQKFAEHIKSLLPLQLAQRHGSHSGGSIQRARKLAAQHPAMYVAFDVLAHPDEGFPDLLPRP